MTWTLWIVYFGLSMSPTRFDVYPESSTCDRLAQTIVAPIIHQQHPTAVVMCYPSTVDHDTETQSPHRSAKKFRGQA